MASADSVWGLVSLSEKIRGQEREKEKERATETESGRETQRSRKGQAGDGRRKAGKHRRTGGEGGGGGGVRDSLREARQQVVEAPVSNEVADDDGPEWPARPKRTPRDRWLVARPRCVGVPGAGMRGWGLRVEQSAGNTTHKG